MDDPAKRETLGRIYEARENGDFTAGVAHFAPDATMFIDPEIPEAGVYEGLEGIRRYTRGFLEPWERVSIAAESLRETGDVVLVKVKQSGVGKDSGAEVTMDYFHVWRFRDGMVIRLESILHEAKALEAAGLAEPSG